MQLLLHKRPYTPPSIQNIHFLQHAYQFSQCMKWAIFQINADFLMIYQNINILTHETLYPFFYQKKLALFTVNVFQNIHFFPNFHYL